MRTPLETRRPRPRRGRRSTDALNATIREVAGVAGVSVATVSRVLNGKGPVRDITSRRVQAAADRLRYVPHGGARSLITRRTNAIGVLLPDLFGEFFSEAIRGIDHAARGAGYQLLVSGSHGNRAQAETALRAMRGRVDGLVVMSPNIDGPTLSANLPEGWPVMLLNCAVDGAAFDSINIDNEGGAAAMVEHLAGLGHRRIAHVTGPPDNWDARERLRGYRRAVLSSGGEYTRELEVPGDFTEESGYQAARFVLGMEPTPTAIFTANDSMAIGLLAAFQEMGVRVPGDVAVGGFDDIPIARFMTPPLSSVSVSIADLGARAMGRLLAALKEGSRHVPRHETLPARLVVRSSSGSRSPKPPKSSRHSRTRRKDS
ncbi:MAG TPA: LacI family DNA-binding transcriptional regulator [Thermoanaerobaculia bacterium]|nr:LacI family DNA-binding transcriptional regulator [Thermoanaerobaculia bacterium]